MTSPDDREGPVGDAVEQPTDDLALDTSPGGTGGGATTRSPYALPHAPPHLAPARGSGAYGPTRLGPTGAGQTRTEPVGVPSRPEPLPPPRPDTTAAAAAATQHLPGGNGSTTVVPGRRPVDRPGDPRTAPRAPARPGPSPVRGRKAKLALRRLDPWSVFVTSLLLSLFLAVVTMVAAVVLFGILDKWGVLDNINKTQVDIQGGEGSLTRGRFIGGAALLAGINVVLLTVLATLGALLYNVCATFTGGVEVTLAEQE